MDLKQEVSASNSVCTTCEPKTLEIVTMNDPLLSIIVPVYKTEAYLEKCIDSILSQSYTNLEVILVDDGSPDNCGNICEEYAAKDTRVKVIHKENNGQGAERNRGLDVANGDWFTFVDSDDWIDSDMYEKLMSLARTKEADIVEGGYRFYRPWKTEDKYLDGSDDGTIKEYTNIEALRELYFGPQMFGGLASMVCTKIYRSSLLKRIRFYEGCIAYEDIVYAPMAYFAAKKIVKLNKSFYNYNIHLGANSTSGMCVNMKKTSSQVYMFEQLKSFFNENYVQGITEYINNRNIDIKESAYYDFYIIEKRDKISCKNERQSILSDLKKIRAELQSRNEYRPGIKTKLFFFSTKLFCVAVSCKRTMKQIKYKATVFFTGKN